MNKVGKIVGTIIGSYSCYSGCKKLWSVSAIFMTLNEFLKPTKNKILLFILLLGFFFTFFGDPYRFAICDPCGCYHKWGYPLTFLKENAIGASWRPFSCGTKVIEYNYTNLVIDVVFWYLISCFFGFSYNKLKSKKISLRFSF